MAKLSSTLLVISFLLLVSFTLTSASSRPLHQASALLTTAQSKEGGEIAKVQVEVVEEECSSKDEECLLRRKTMDAHLDYIYTQHNGSHHP